MFTAHVSGACMAPLIRENDQVGIRRRRFYLPGDVVAYTNDRGEHVCHRLLGYAWHRGTWKAMTKSDRALAIDGLLATDRLLGRVERVNRELHRVRFRSRGGAFGHWIRSILGALHRRVRSAI